MRRLHRIIHSETRGPFVITLTVLTFVVFTREFGRLAELLIQRNAEPVTVAKVVLYLLPTILVFTVPFAFLIGTLIGFSRLSSDSEVIAMRAGGISVYQMLRPVLKVAIGIVLVTAAFTFYLSPEGNWKLRLLRHDVRISPTYNQIKPRVFFEEFPNTLLYVEDIDLDTESWEGIFLADSSDPNEERVILARKGRLFGDAEGRRIQFHFESGSAYTVSRQNPDRITVSRFATLDIPIDRPTEESEGIETKRARDMTLMEIVAQLRTSGGADPHDDWVELNRRIALPLGALVFAVLAVTFGIGTPRKGRGYGLIISVTLAFTYYILFATGSTLSKNGVLPIWLGVWGANIFAVALAVASLRFAEHDSPIAHRLGRTAAAVCITCALERWRTRIGNLVSRVRSRLERKSSRLPAIRFRLARIVDLYMVRSFLANFLIILSACLLLVCLFTFFEIIDDIFQNNIPYGLVLNYFIFLQPQLLMLLVPISVLIATLVTFGSLEKFNQITAFKSCGISVYRIAVPIFVFSLLVSGFMFVLQEYVLPYANQRQDGLRNTIKGSPAQVSQPGRHWIFGEDGRLYNYYLFSYKLRTFVELSVFHLDFNSDEISEMVFAHQAEWDRVRQDWLLRNGWFRDFKGQSFSAFEAQSFEFAEHPEFFDEEVRDSSKMTFEELREYIANLQIGGFEVDYLKTELYKKLSFPIVTVIMALLGVPFSLTMGKKGRLYGVAAGVILGIAYWGAFGVFDVLGANGLLAPIMAAWGPNVVFGTSATILLTMVRT
jgi:LPS export ABC transporter permease LptF/LPS export ABC transporter permease LptG